MCCALAESVQDVGAFVVLKGTHYIAIGEHADLWEGEMSDKKVGLPAFLD